MRNLSECGRRLKWAGGENDFDLGDRRVFKVLAGALGSVPIVFMQRGYPMFGGVLQGQYGDTPAACLKRFDQSVYSLTDVERVIELGLWGGGMQPADVVSLSDRFVRGKPLAANASLAFEVLAALFVKVGENGRAST